MDFDSVTLVAKLRAHVAGEVLADAGSRAIYSADASNYRHVPQAIVLPRTADDVAAALALCREHGAPLTMRGAGTSIAGNAIGTGVVLDTSRHLGQILAVDESAATAVVQPGVIGGHLRARLAPLGLAFAPDPSTVNRCTIGGMLGNNSCGSHSVAWGKTSDNVRELDVLLADGTRMTLGPQDLEAFAANVARPGRVGEVYRGLEQLAQENLGPLRTELGQFPRHLSGYALHQLLPDHHRNLARAVIGSEGTCAIVLGATLDLVRPPAHRALLVLGFDDEVRSAEAVPELLTCQPLTIEGMSRAMFEGVRLHGERARIISALPQTPDWLFVEAGGESPAGAEAAANAIARQLGSTRHVVFTDPRTQLLLWGLRSDGSGLATRTVDGRAAYPGFEDAAVPPERLAGYLRDFRELLAEHGLFGISYGHFGDGCIHIRLDADLSSAGGVAGYRKFLESAADLVAAHGGSISGEHGDGQARSELLARTYSPHVIGLFERFKGIWDPENVLNPGILAAPRKLDANVRWLELGTREVQVEYAYPDDEGSFPHAVSRCVGVGKCRVDHSAAMCPSYQVTRDEQHSTRGRARLLFEMLEGSTITDGWRSTEVLEALDLCLSCKACKVECPVNVDMATYKSEFLFHHYEGRIRPRAHYALGRLPQWARLAALAPALVNRATANPALARLGKAAAGVDQRRDLPAFAPATLRKLARARTPGPGGRGQVLLWPDTFTNHLSPQVGIAAMDVLEDAGFEVLLPGKPVCCGLTAISTGQLPLARRVARRSLKLLEPYLAQGIPVIGLEPSCTAVLRTELPRLLPDDSRARQLADATRTFAEQLHEHTEGWTPPRVDADAVVQTHCHQYADLGDDADQKLMGQAGIRPAEMAPGCCGLAGNFGFEDGHYDVSMAVAEQSLLPAIRAAGPDANVIADGFSCRTQVRDGAGLGARHLAEVLADALNQVSPRR
ncbi:FAD-binding and (Fe-S)-binding domain-containing protein [Tomitella biformata]|uniref:FAD-binding and (Fe-S)-binding domain-containing protein n=1 Tax=Tomitella biformata TaxID=630403 RepID=UPI0004632BDA|nr:FAD-binding and (Fe-S)-binding domain-containing protein [Tomitella biformata]